MKTDGECILGILGGMGPMAGVELQKRIIEKMPAKADQDHIKMVCFTNPKIKDRTASLKKGADFSTQVIESLNLMAKFNVNLGVMTCNTAHASFDKISSKVNFPMINIIEETAVYIARKFAFAGKVGLLATDGTIQSGIYEEALKKRGLSLVVLSNDGQREVMDVIYGRSGIKSGCINSNRVKIVSIIKNLEISGADVVILGCTELSLLGIEGKNIVDPLEVAAEVVVKKNLLKEFK
jgi:aspartate racemase